MMSLYSQNNALMCTVFPTALRWFNGLRKESIHNFGVLIQEFGAHFRTCSHAPQLVGALLFMKMGVGKTLIGIGSCIMRLVGVTRK